MKIIYASAEGPKPRSPFEYIVTVLASTVVDKPFYCIASGHHSIVHFMLRHEQQLVLVLSILSLNSTQLSPPGLFLILYSLSCPNCRTTIYPYKHQTRWSKFPHLPDLITLWKANSQSFWMFCLKSWNNVFPWSETLFSFYILLVLSQ